MTDDINYYHDKYNQAGSSFYYSIYFLSAEKKSGLVALCGFWQSVQAVLHNCQDPGVARTKLYWWLGDTAKIATQEAEHPLNKILQTHAEHFLISEKLQTVIKGILYRLDHPHFQSRVELTLFCEQTGGNIMQARSIFLGNTEPLVLAFAEALGIAIQQVALLRDLTKDLAHGYVFIPIEDLTTFGVTLADLHNKKINAFFDDYAQGIKNYYDKALNLLPAQDHRQQLSNLIFAKLKMRLLEEIKRDHYSVLTKKISLTPLRKLWIAWRLQRKA